MIIRRKTRGTYLDFALDGTRLTLGHGALILELSDHQQDWPVQLDVCDEADGRLVLGLGLRYAAQVDLPARAFTIVKGKPDNMGFQQLSKVTEPLDPAHVSLTLWAL